MRLQNIFRGDALNAVPPLEWWREGLLCCLPVHLRRQLLPAQVKWVVEVADDTARCLQLQGESRNELGRYTLPALQAGARLNAACGGRSRLVTLRLPAAWMLRRRVHFPAATRENLGRVIGFEMDRLTPFSPDQVLYDFRLAGEASGGAELVVDLAVLPRVRVEPWLQVLAAGGIRPAVVDVEGLWPRANLLPAALRPTSSRREKTLNTALAGTLALLIAAALAAPLWQKRQVVMALNDLVAREKRQADVVLAIRERVEKSEDLLHFAPNLRQERMTVIDTLNVLTGLLPDHTWVQQLDMKGDSVELRGVSQQATALIRTLEDSKFFTQVGFRSPVLQNQGQENFHLAAKIADAGSRAQAGQLPAAVPGSAETAPPPAPQPVISPPPGPMQQPPPGPPPAEAKAPARSPVPGAPVRHPPSTAPVPAARPLEQAQASGV